MLPLWTQANADLVFQTLMLLTAGLAVVCSSLMTWLRC